MRKLQWTTSDGEKIDLDAMGTAHLKNAIIKRVTHLYWGTVLEVADGAKILFSSTDLKPSVLSKDKLYVYMLREYRNRASTTEYLNLGSVLRKITDQGLPLDEKNRIILTRVAKERRLKAIRSEARKLVKEVQKLKGVRT